MPTLYTSLRAWRRHKLVPPEPRLPKTNVFAAPAGLTPLQGAKQFSAPEVTPVIETAAIRKPTRRVIVMGAGLAVLCAAYELRDLGYDVKVHEARPRVAGRIFLSGSKVKLSRRTRANT